ncbi:MAG: hypothetical protein ACTH7J_15630, partial [Glutamicibacter ardleyensis]
MSGDELLTSVQSENQTAQGPATAGRTPPRTANQLKAGFPARVQQTSWPSTCLDRTAVIERVLAAPFKLNNTTSQYYRRKGVLAVLGWLSTFPGETWQQRWEVSGAEEAKDWRELFTGDCADGPHGSQPPHLSSGLLMLICADVIRPSLLWLLSFPPARRNLAFEMARTRDAVTFSAMNDTCTTEQVGLLGPFTAVECIVWSARHGRSWNRRISADPRGYGSTALAGPLMLP